MLGVEICLGWVDSKWEWKHLTRYTCKQDLKLRRDDCNVFVVDPFQKNKHPALCGVDE